MQNHQLPEREEEYLEVQISIIASKKLHQIHMLAYNSFPSGAYPKRLKQLKRHLSHIIFSSISKLKQREEITLKIPYQVLILNMKDV